MVLRGSTAAVSVPASAAHHYAARIRQRLLKSGVLAEQDGLYVFQEDYLFTTPSGAADAVLGRNSNGWTAWRDASGRTLDELKRQRVNGEGHGA